MRLSAVDEDRFPSHSGRLSREEERRLGDLFGRDQVTQQGGFATAVKDFRRPARESSLDQARCKSVHADVRSQGSGERFRHIHDSSLGGGVGDRTAGRVQGRSRGVVDDCAAAGSPHQSHSLPDTIEGGLEIHAQGAVPDFVGQGIEVSVTDDLAPARVVDENVQAAPTLVDGGDHPGYLDLPRHIGLHSERFPAPIANRVYDLVRLVSRGAVVYRDLCALRGKQFCDGRAHSGRSAGNQGNFRLKSHFGHCRRLVPILALAVCPPTLPGEYRCGPDPKIVAELETVPLAPPPGMPPFEHWRKSLARVEALRARRPDDLFVRERWTLLRRRLLLPAIPAGDNPTALDFYLSGLADGKHALESWSRAAEMDPDFPWSHLALAKASEGAVARLHAQRFLRLCPGHLDGLAALFPPPKKLAAEITRDRRKELKAESGAPLRPVEEFRQERARFDRIRTTGLPASPEARQAFWRKLLRASDSWIERWPDREFAWRDRLQALCELEDVPKDVVRQTADGALAALREPDGIWFGADPTYIRIARAYVRHGVRLNQVPAIVALGLSENRALGDRAEVLALGVLRDLAVRMEEPNRLRDLLPRMRAATRTTGLTPSERAGRERDYRLAAAWLLQMSGQPERAIRQLEQAFNARPVYRKRSGTPPQTAQPQNEGLYQQGRRLWIEAGRAGELWPNWVAQRSGISISIQVADN